jgi:hypothetical protein
MAPPPDRSGPSGLPDGPTDRTQNGPTAGPPDPPADPPARPGAAVTVALGAAVAVAWLLGVWWSARYSVALLLSPPDGLRVCPAIDPPPGWCDPGRHVAIAAAASAAVLVAHGVLVHVALHASRARVTRLRLSLAAVMATGLLALVVTQEPYRLLPTG